MFTCFWKRLLIYLFLVCMISFIFFYPTYAADTSLNFYATFMQVPDSDYTYFRAGSSNQSSALVFTPGQSSSIDLPFYYSSSFVSTMFTGTYRNHDFHEFSLKIYMPASTLSTFTPPVVSIADSSGSSFSLVNSSSTYTIVSRPSWYNVNFSSVACATYNFKIAFNSINIYRNKSETFWITFSGLNGRLGFELLYPNNSNLAPYLILYSESDLIASKPIEGTVDDIDKTIKEQHQRDEDDANQAGEDAGSLVTEMQSLESKWEILWFPIKFTKQVIDVFSGGSGASVYSDRYFGVTGYEYDESSGFLKPIRPKIITFAAASSGASIIWPEYTLPVLNVKLWDSYTFDLSTIKESFPALFNALYVFITILEAYWFIAFLRDKYDEVFGG